MSIVSLDGLIFCGLDMCLYCYHGNTQRPVYGMLRYTPVHFRDQHMICQDNKF